MRREGTGLSLKGLQKAPPPCHTGRSESYGTNWPLGYLSGGDMGMAVL